MTRPFLPILFASFFTTCVLTGTVQAESDNWCDDLYLHVLPTNSPIEEGHASVAILAGYRGVITTPWLAISDPHVVILPAERIIVLDGKLTPPIPGSLAVLGNRQILREQLSLFSHSDELWFDALIPLDEILEFDDNPWLKIAYLHLEIVCQLDKPSLKVSGRLCVLDSINIVCIEAQWGLFNEDPPSSTALGHFPSLCRMLRVRKWGQLQ